MKICILTFEFNYNYGAVLQAFALSKILQKLGHDVNIMNRGWESYAGVHSSRMSVKEIPGYLMGKYLTLKPFNDFKRQNLKLSRPIENYEDLCLESKKFDLVIVGSDQIWNDEIFPHMGLYYFAESFKSIPRIAYAVSFGKDTFYVPEQFKKNLLRELAKFSALSVREDSGIHILSNLGFQAKIVLDPTFLLPKEDYPIAPLSHKHKYVCRFFLDENSSKRKFVHDFAKLHSYREVNNYLNKDYSIPFIRKIINNKYISIPKWLSNIKNAEFVITDSFHGMVFSIIFEKQFLVFRNKKRGNARFESLLRRLGLMNHLISEEAAILGNYVEIDYATVNKKLEILRDDSLNYLKSALLSKALKNDE